MAAQNREQLKSKAARIVIKVGSAIITQENGELSKPRLTHIVQQIAELHRQGKEVIIVSSGAVAFGRRKIRNTREKQSASSRARPLPGDRAAAAIGQSGLISFYEGLFQIYDIELAQILVTKADLCNEDSRIVLRDTVLDILKTGMVPIVNTNDACEVTLTHDLTRFKKGDMSDIIVEDNDSLASMMAAELDSNLLIILSNVDGVYSGPPHRKDSIFFHTFTPRHGEANRIEYGIKSDVGLGGMETKVKSALWALKHGTSVVVCNGSTSDVLTRVVNGDRVGTFFTEHDSEVESACLASKARNEEAAK